MRSLDHRNIESNSELLALRDRLVKQVKVLNKLKAAKAKSTAETPERPHLLVSSENEETLPSFDFASAVEVILAIIETGASSSSTTNETTLETVVLAFDALDLVLRRANPPDQDSHIRLVLTDSLLLHLADLIYAAWELRTTTLQQKCRASIVSLLEFADAIPSLIVFEHVRAKVLVAPWTVKRSLNTLDVLICRPRTTIENMSSFNLRSDESTASGVMRRFAEGMLSSEEMAYPAGRVVTNWNRKVWNDDQQDPLFWLEPSLDVLKSASRSGRTNLVLYLFPGIFEKRKSGLRELLNKGHYLEEAHQKEEDDLHTLLALLKVGHGLNLVDITDAVSHSTTTEAQDPNSNVVSISQDLLNRCLYHASPSLRTSAFSLLVSSSSNHLALPLTYFPLLETFYTYSLGDEDGEFRMTSVALTGKLLLRLRDSAWKAQRRLNKTSDSTSSIYIQHVENFVTFFSKLLLVNLNPAKPFRIRANSLRYLELLFQAKLDRTYGSSTLSPLGGYSTYRKTSTTTAPSFQKKHKKVDLDSANGLGQEHDWPFEIKLVTPESTFILLRILLSTYTSLRELTISTLERFPAPLPGYEGFEGGEKAKRELLGPAIKMLKSGREAEASAGAGIVGLVWRKWVLEGEGSWKLGEIGGWKETEKQGPAGFAFLNSMMDLADSQLASFESDLARAATTSPMHGTLLGLRHLFTSIPLNSLETLSNAQERRALFHRALGIVERVWAVTSPVLAASAPEGVTEMDEAMVVDTEEARALRFEDDGDVEMDLASAEGNETADGVGGPKHKVILSATWRAMKEAGELLETILRLPSELGVEDFKTVWSFEEIEHIGSLFALWLARIRHRGAFMALHPCYSRAAAALLQCDDWPQVKALPVEWLRMHIDSITSQKISITRRSAGIPYCILGILTVILGPDRASFDAAFRRLFEIAESTSSDILDESRVHAMNTIRTAFLDAKCTNGVTPFVERGFLLSISLFWSPNWICRNVAMMTYASLVTRAFTSRRTNLNRDHESLQIRLSTADFFGRYPSLHKVLLNELEKSTEENLDDLPTSDLHSSLFSVLMLLSMLQSPDQVGKLEDELAEPFIPIVRTCAKSKVWKIRDAAGDALTGLIQPRNVAQTCVKLLEGIDSLDENETHGRLVQVLRLLEASSPLRSADGDLLSFRLETIAPILLARHHSFSVRTTFLSICKTSALSYGYRSSTLLDLVYEQLDSSRSWPQTVAHLPSAENFVAAAFSLALVYEPDSCTLISAGLAAPFLEVQRLALNHLQNRPESHSFLLPNLLDLALSEDAASECRIEAVEILTVCDWSGHEVQVGKVSSKFESQREGTNIVPLKEALLPLLAKLVNLEGSIKGAEKVLEKTEESSHTQESIESREASARALHQLRLPTIVKSDQCVRLLLRLLQDDDPMVREIASEVATREYTSGFVLSERRCIETILSSVGPTTLAHSSKELEADLALLSNPSTLLFAIEKANIYQDDLIEPELYNGGSKVDSAEDLSNAVAGLRRALEASPKPDGPLGLHGNDLVCKWSYRLTKSAEAQAETGATLSAGDFELLRTLSRTFEV